VFAILLSLLITASVLAQTAVRLSWETFAKDPKRVAAFRKAVATMKSRNTADPKSAQYRTSWTYWGNIHGYFGPQSPDGTIEAYIQWMKDNGYWEDWYEPYFQGVVDVTPPDQVAKDIWSTCQHGTPWFYAWHRLYLYYFERTLQVAAGDDTLRLPYWDYTNTAYLGMPVEFTSPTYVDDKGKTQPNPLYEPRRLPGWKAPASLALDGTDTDIDDALGIDSFFDTTSNGKPVPGYQSTIENAPHGYVHCAVMDCPAVVMGAVPYSSNDPIFWLHHCNIDRTWTCWTSISGHNNPTQSWFRNKKFSYVNEKGVKVTKAVSSLFSGSLIDYVYEQPANCARNEAPPPAAVEAVQMTPAQVQTAKANLAKPLVLSTKKKVALSAASVHTELAVAEDTSSKRTARTLAMAAETPQLPVVANLVLRGIHWGMPPRSMIRVYIARKDDPAQRVYVGAITFFVSPTRHNHDTHTLNRMFDITEELRQLGLTGDAQDAIDVQFETGTGDAAARAASFNPKSNVVIDEIELHVKEK
jgi:hypothetical protein